MTLAEYKAAIQKVIEGGDDAVDTATLITDALQADDEARTVANDKIKEQSETIKKLKSQLFLSKTGGDPKDATGKTEPEETPEDEFTKLFNERYYGGEK